MLIYVSHAYDNLAVNIRKAKRITDELQRKDFPNHYYCPLTAIACLTDKDVSDDDKTALKLDMLMVCDSLLIASEITEDMKDEIDFANAVHMEVLVLNENGVLQPFEERVGNSN